MSTKLVEAASAFLAARTSRRGFLARTALVGSAVAAAPLGYSLRPGTAYAAVCGPSTSCGAGYTVFCCTINRGSNSCPPGTLAAGWWKADGASICGGRSRYIIDCNASCSGCSSGCGHFCSSSCWSCRCGCGPSTSCDQRRVCCNVFRYGQCHQEVPCVGPVACRVVTCVAPYELGLSCSTASATDNATRDHTAPCNLNVWDSLAARYYALGGSSSILGTTTGDEYAVGAGSAADFSLGSLYSSTPTGLHFVREPLRAAYRRASGPTGPLGFPRSDEGTASPDGRFTTFSGGIIVWGPRTGARVLLAAISAKYLALHGTLSALGFPTSDEAAAAPSGRFALFERGVMVSTSTAGTWAVSGPIGAHYLAVGGTRSRLGAPTEDTRASGPGQVNLFQGGVMYWSAATGAHWFGGAIQARYVGLGGSAGRLGLPVTDPYPVAFGEEVGFVGGWIRYDARIRDAEVRYR